MTDNHVFIHEKRSSSADLSRKLTLGCKHMCLADYIAIMGGSSGVTLICQLPVTHTGSDLTSVSLMVQMRNGSVYSESTWLPPWDSQLAINILKRSPEALIYMFVLRKRPGVSQFVFLVLTDMQ